MMFKKCSNFHRCILRSFNFIETVYELFDNPSYMSLFIYLTIYMYLLSFVKFLYILFLIISFTNQYILFQYRFIIKLF